MHLCVVPFPRFKPHKGKVTKEYETMTNPTEQALLQIAETIERAVDDEMERIDQMEDDELLAIRRKRMEQLREVEKRREQWLKKGHGRYTEITDIKEFFSAVQGSERVVVHFMRRSTPRCAVIDRHLNVIAQEHFETRFCYVDVERIPALPAQYNVMMLPTLMLIEKGNTFHSIIGFDEFGGTDDFTTETVKQVLAFYGMVNEKGMFSADQNDD